MTATPLSIPYADGALGQPIRQIADIIRQSAVAFADDVALREEAGDTTYRQLDERSSQFANALIAAGVKPEERIALVSGNSHYFMEIVYGAAKMGAIAAPANTRLAPMEIVRVLGSCDPTVLFVGAEEQDAAPEAGAVPSIRISLDPESYEKFIEGQPTTDPGYNSEPTDTGVILFSSGTTGLPKGIKLSGINFSGSQSAPDDRVPFEGTGIYMAPVPFFHITGLTSALSANAKGGVLLLKMPKGPGDLIRLLTEEKVTHAVGVPTLLQMITQHPDAKTADWSHLKYFGYGGAPMPVSVIKAATELIGCGLFQGYGMTETTAAVTVLWPEDHLPTPGREKQIGSVGKALNDTEIRIVDMATREPLPVGERGEIQVRGSRVTAGYWNRDDETSRALSEDGWLSTGDGGSLDDEGYLYLADRIKDMIVSGGENVYPAEVENALSNHPEIAEVAVIGVPSEKWGESPYAIVVRRPDTNPTEDDIIGWSREQIAHFKCPVGVAFVDVLPRNPNGKILKRVLREQFS